MIRSFNRNDKEEVLKLLQLNIPKYFAVSEEVDFIEYLDSYLEDYFVFEINNKIIGVGGINYFPTNRFARISWDFVHPDFHGKGIGTQLLKHRIDHLNKNSLIERVEVRTSQHAYQYYGKFGFELEKIEKDYWGKGFDLYQMRMLLSW